MAFIALLLLAFLAGILTFLTPCTLPVLPAYLSFAARKGEGKEEGRHSTVLRTVAFGLGVLVVFILLGVLAGSVGRLITANKRAIAMVSGTLLLLLGVLVLFEQSIPCVRIHKRTTRSMPGTFAFGLIFALSWSGCIGPVLGLALILAANTQTAVGGAILLAVYALGLILPLVAVSAYLDRLPKEGRLWKTLKGRTIRVGTVQVHTTSIIIAAMLFILGGVFLFGLDTWLARSPFIMRVFDFEESVASALNITLGT